jgi:hypothetical protein
MKCGDGPEESRDHEFLGKALESGVKKGRKFTQGCYAGGDFGLRHLVFPRNKVVKMVIIELPSILDMTTAYRVCFGRERREKNKLKKQEKELKICGLESGAV